MNKIAADAKELLSVLSLYRLPVDPIAICKKLNIEYDERPYEGFDGTLIVLGDRQLIGINSSIIEPGRKSFTCAHELGHAQYDAGSKKYFQCTRDNVGYGRQEVADIEVRANDFASELLMPRELFIQVIAKSDPSWTLLRDLAEKFGTSLQATTNRFVKLSHHTCWLVVVREGAIQRYTKADHNEFSPQVHRTFRAPASDPGQFRETSASSWLYENYMTKNKKIHYWALPKNRYGESLVLLWDKGHTLHNNSVVGDELDEELARRDDDLDRRSRW